MASLFDRYIVTIRKPLTIDLDDEAYGKASAAIHDEELCSLLELVAQIYLDLNDDTARLFATVTPENPADRFRTLAADQAQAMLRELVQCALGDAPDEPEGGQPGPDGAPDDNGPVPAAGPTDDTPTPTAAELARMVGMRANVVAFASR